MNVKMLKSAMVLFGDEDFVRAIASILNISRQTAASRLNCTTEFTQTEIAIIANRYQLTDEEIRKIFIEGDSKDDSEGSSEIAR